MQLNYTIFDHEDALRLAKRFKRKCPKEEIYIKRLAEELHMIIKKKLVDQLLFAADIVDLTKDIPHITRGSSGSSFISYLLGISIADPIKENISFARFLNDFRNTLPDFDFDFPENKRNQVFAKIFKKWPNQVARISNHVKYKEKGALRKAISEMGYKKRVPRNKCNTNFFGNEKKEELIQMKNKFLGKQKCYSRHVGGIILFPDGIPNDIKLNDTQVKYNKEDVDRLKIFKVDILSNRGLSVLLELSNLDLDKYPHNDQKTIDILCSAKNIGLVYAESRAMHKLFHIVKPKNIEQLSTILALVRPMASDNKNKLPKENKNSSEKCEQDDLIIYDDDAIKYIAKNINCSEDLADLYRKAFSKNKFNDINSFNRTIANHPNKHQILHNLSKLRKYSFCKAHSIAYAYVVWALAYHKAYSPQKFWIAVLNHCHSQYRYWVHFREAVNVGLQIPIGAKKPFKLADDLKTVISFNNSCKNKSVSLEKLQQYKIYGYWVTTDFLDNMHVTIIDSKKNIVNFRGLIANSRWHREYSAKNNKSAYNTFITIGYKNDHYIDLVLDKWQTCRDFDAIEGTAYVKHDSTNNFLQLIAINYKMLVL